MRALGGGCALRVSEGWLDEARQITSLLFDGPHHGARARAEEEGAVPRRDEPGTSASRTQIAGRRGVRGVRGVQPQRRAVGARVLPPDRSGARCTDGPGPEAPEFPG